MATNLSQGKYRVTLIQSNPVWECPAENLLRLEKLIGTLKEESDAILLPEMFTTGFTMNSAAFAEEPGGRVTEWMKSISAAVNRSLAGSVIMKEGGKIFNRLLWVNADGKVLHYDKRHLFFNERESNAYTRGRSRIVINHNGLRILPAICYDLRFPVWLRNRGDYDAIFLVANWPAARREVWMKLLMARAIENQCYVAAVNRTGTDGNGLEYKGESLVVDPRGNVIHMASENDEEVITVSLDVESLQKFRQKFPVWLDSDDFEIKL